MEHPFDSQAGLLIEAVTDLIVFQLKEKWDHIFYDYPPIVCHRLSNMAKEVDFINAEDPNFVYGEISFLALADILLHQLELPQGGVFYDLGSGTGRGVIGAALLHDFSKCRGIEYLSTLHEAGEIILTTYKDVVSEIDRRSHASTELKPLSSQDVLLVNDDFLKVDWSDGDVVFMNSTCFDSALIQKIETQALKLRKGARVITTTQKLTSLAFRLVKYKKYDLSWGHATVHMYEKVTEPITDLPLLPNATASSAIAAAAVATDASSESSVSGESHISVDNPETALLSVDVGSGSAYEQHNIPFIAMPQESPRDEESQREFELALKTSRSESVETPLTAREEAIFQRHRTPRATPAASPDESAADSDEEVRIPSKKPVSSRFCTIFPFCG